MAADADDDDDDEEKDNFEPQRVLFKVAQREFKLNGTPEAPRARNAPTEVETSGEASQCGPLVSIWWSSSSSSLCCPRRSTQEAQMFLVCRHCESHPSRANKLIKSSREAPQVVGLAKKPANCDQLAAFDATSGDFE